MEDALSDIFRLIRLKGCVYFVRDFWSPWGIDIDAGPYAQFHAVVRGDAAVRVAGKTYALAAGDVVLLSQGSAHILADSADSLPTPGEEVMRSLAGPEPLFSAGEKSARMLCGHFEFRDDFRHPLIATLPPVLHVEGFDTLSPGSIESVLPLLLGELDAGRPGGSSVVERLAEVLIIQVLRVHLGGQPDAPGFLAGLNEPRLARAIRLVHQHPARKLSLADLATAAGMSRSAFAQRFRARTGLSAIDYLTKWRMYTASDLLSAGDMPLSVVAARVGYESDIAFGRAFKRTFGTAPGRYRKRLGTVA